MISGLQLDLIKKKIIHPRQEKQGINCLTLELKAEKTLKSLSYKQWSTYLLLTSHILSFHH